MRLKLPTPLPPWLVEELVEDLQDTATDLGSSYLSESNAEVAMAEHHYEQAVQRLSYAINLLYEAADPT